ncbi:hypothetical protein J6590_091125 [Homalodisca vitripennis]|nr:hypothetical protein J6590_091125 [Homalodisca vitripennis]
MGGNLARDLTDHHEHQHGDHLLRFRCTRCRPLFKTYRGHPFISQSVRVSRSRGRSLPHCGRVFPSRRGLGVHRSAHHPERVNVKRLREEDRRAVTASLPPTRPWSSGWTEDEDRTFIRGYLEFKTTGRAMGYSAYVALELPRKTERQIRDRLSGPPKPELDIAPVGHDASGAPTPGRTDARWDMTHPGHLHLTPPRTDMTPPGTPNETPLQQLITETEHLDWTTPRWDMTPPGLLDKTMSPDVTSPQRDMTPLGSLMVKTPWAMTPRGRDLWPMAGSPNRSESDYASRAGRGDGSGLGAPAEPPEGEQGPATATPHRETSVSHLLRQRPPGDSPPASPPGAAPDPGLRQGHWQKVLDEILGTEPVCHVGARLKELAAQEGDIQVRLDELLEELQAAMVATQPVMARVRRPANPTTGGSERTRRKVTRYARTQELYKKNPSCLADLVLKNELGDLLADGPRVIPQKRETLELYRGMWGAPVDCTLSLRGVDLQEDELVESFTGNEVRRKTQGQIGVGDPGHHFNSPGRADSELYAVRPYYLPRVGLFAEARFHQLQASPEGADLDLLHEVRDAETPIPLPRVEDAISGGGLEVQDLFVFCAQTSVHAQMVVCRWRVYGDCKRRHYICHRKVNLLMGFQGQASYLGRRVNEDFLLRELSREAGWADRWEALEAQ